MPSNLRDKPLIACLHPYVEERRKDIEQGLYPRHHLWGIEDIEKEKNWRTKTISSTSVQVPTLLERLLDRSIFRGSPGTKVELAALQASRISDLVYSVCGPLALAKTYSNKLVSWTFRNPIDLGSSFKLSHRAYRPRNLSANAAFFCLTSKSESSYANFAPSRFIPWCVDMDLFDGLPSAGKPQKPFFLATGKTGRDYCSLVKGSSLVNAEVRIIGPSHQKPDRIPPNVKWIDTSKDPPDQAIDYPTLREWYAQCTAVCIPLSGDSDDTCGYTNMLEAMAMRKPVLMTHSGCLDIDPETRGFGKLIEPQDHSGWTDAMNYILKDKKRADRLGEEGRRMTEKEFTIERFNRDVLKFLRELLENRKELVD